MGDFNLHHEQWDEGNTTREDKAEELVEWMEARRILCANDPSTPTQEKGAILDLTILSADCWHKVAHYNCGGELECGSDHSPQILELSVRAPKSDKIPVRRMEVTDPQIFADSCRRTASIMEQRFQMEDFMTVQALDETAEQLLGGIQEAFEEATPTRHVSKSGYKWWNSECREKHREACAAKNSLLSLLYMKKLGASNLGPEITEAKRVNQEAQQELQESIKKASGDFHKKLTATLKGLPEVHRAAKWLMSPQRALTPALRAEDGTLKSIPEEKVKVLRAQHLSGNGMTDLPRPHIDQGQGRNGSPSRKQKQNRQSGNHRTLHQAKMESKTNCWQCAGRF
ncbi:uncharacterized protein BROUX77_003217 [Berkeleyomyces rouxiae]|uniref:uncharacterized protein n=1 Tax=Berkeleyomyces rouxiae TaxID=2035830 RepID=UPI003B80A19D